MESNLICYPHKHSYLYVRGISLNNNTDVTIITPVWLVCAYEICMPTLNTHSLLTDSTITNMKWWKAICYQICQFVISNIPQSWVNNQIAVILLFITPLFISAIKKTHKSDTPAYRWHIHTGCKAALPVILACLSSSMIPKKCTCSVTVEAQTLNQRSVTPLN